MTNGSATNVLMPRARTRATAARMMTSRASSGLEEPGRKGALLGREVCLGQKVGPQPRRALDGVSPAPGVHLGVVAGEQHLGHASSLVVCWPRVLRVLEKARGERLVDGAHLVTEGAGQKPDHRIRDNHGRKLAPGEHVVAKAQRLVGKLVDALVHALVAPADEHEPLLAGEALGDRLGERGANGREEDDASRARVRGQDVSHGLEDGGRLHEHALTSPKGGVIDRAVPIVGPVSQVVGAKLEDALGLGAPHDGGAQVGVENTGEDRERLDEHA